MTHFQVDNTVGHSLLGRRAHLEAIPGYSFLPPISLDQVKGRALP